MKQTYGRLDISPTRSKIDNRAVNNAGVTTIRVHKTAVAVNRADADIVHYLQHATEVATCICARQG